MGAKQELVCWRCAEAMDVELMPVYNWYARSAEHAERARTHEISAFHHPAMMDRWCIVCKDVDGLIVEKKLLRNKT